jgi:hypothetical protein
MLVHREHVVADDLALEDLPVIEDVRHDHAEDEVGQRVGEDQAQGKTQKRLPVSVCSFFLQELIQDFNHPFLYMGSIW